MKKLVRSALVAVAIVLVATVTTAGSPASAQTFIGGNSLSTAGACGLGRTALYGISWGNYGFAQQVRIYTRIYGGATYVSPWTTAARPGTVGTLNGVAVPRGSSYAHYIEYREFNIAYQAQYPSRGGWYVGGEWVLKGNSTWCQA